MASIKEFNYFGTNVGFDPVGHSSENDSYGVGNASLYGHLKLSDTVSSEMTVDNGIAATPNAVHSVNVNLSNHINATATSSVASHVKLSDSVSDSTSDNTKFTAATPKAVNTVNSSLSTHIGTTGSSSVLGHVKVADTANSGSTAATGWATSPNALYSHSVVYGSSTAFGHVKLSDSANDSSNGQTSSIAATPKAVNTAKSEASSYGANLSNATGTLTVSHGGTGASTLSSGYILTGNDTGAIKSEYSITTNSAGDSKTLPTLSKAEAVAKSKADTAESNAVSTAASSLSTHAQKTAGTSSTAKGGHVVVYVSGTTLYITGKSAE